MRAEISALLARSLLAEGVRLRLTATSVSDPGLLRCPATGQQLVAGEDGELVTEDGAISYPVVADIPILLDERRSPFRIADYEIPREACTPRHFAHPKRALRSLIGAVDRRLPALSHNVGSHENYRRLRELLAHKRRARVLVVGGAIAGVGFETLLEAPNVEIVDVDIAWGPRTTIICDAHDLPFRDGSFDAVVCQAVLEHVLDPARVVQEIHRVLAPDGLVYSEVPFMYQVHGAPYDFTRFTALGHRRLYRHFDVIACGTQCGPGTALGLSLTYFLRSLPRSAAGSALAMRVARLLFFWCKHLDRWLVRRPNAADAAAGTFFLGRRRAAPLADADLIAGAYRACEAFAAPPEPNEGRARGGGLEP